MGDRHRNPTPTVDVIIELEDRGVVLIRRKNPPFGWALPGGFHDAGETAESAAVREALEETSLDVTLIEQFLVYSDPKRDVRGHTMSVVFLATATGEPVAADDAAQIGVFSRDSLPEPLCFDHARILADFFAYRSSGVRPKLAYPPK